MEIAFLERIKPLYDIDILQGYTDADIKLLCDRFGALPQVLEDYYRAAGRTKAFHAVNQDSWILPEHYGLGECLQQTDFMILLDENQSVCHAGIRREDLCLPDPPVYTMYDEGDQALCAPAVSVFLAAALAYEAIFYFEYAPEEFYQLNRKDVELVQSKLTKFPYGMTNWIGGMKITLYQSGMDNMAAVMECGEDDFQMLYGAAHEESYDGMHQILEGIGEPI